jgi:hypothetical protein
LGNHVLYGAGLVNATAAADVPGVQVINSTRVSYIVSDDTGAGDDGVPFSTGRNPAEASA